MNKLQTYLGLAILAIAATVGFAYAQKPSLNPAMVNLVSDLQKGGGEHFKLVIGFSSNEASRAPFLALKENTEAWSCENWLHFTEALKEKNYQFRLADANYHERYVTSPPQSELVKEVIELCQFDQPFTLLISDNRNNVVYIQL